MSFGIQTVVLASAVANGGTVNIAYPTGTVQANYIGAFAAPNTGSAVLNDNDRYPEAASGARVNFTYNSTDVTVTNNTGVSWPAGSKLTVQLGQFGNDRPGITPGILLTSFTDNSGGTASDTLAANAAGASYAQADMVAVRNAISSLAQKVNQIVRALQIEGVWR